MLLLVISWTTFILTAVNSAGILYPRASESREILSLDGLWDFALTNITDDKWYNVSFKTADGIDIQLMPVPSSYNDVGTDVELRDHVGPVWYQRTFFAPKSWKEQKVWIRFSSVCHFAKVWINGEPVVSHDTGHLPFQAEVSSVLNYRNENTITVIVNSTLSKTSIPQGTYRKLKNGRLKQKYDFEFFNYGGIDRPVVLYTTPSTYIDDITVTTDVDGADGYVNYSLVIEGSDDVTATVTLLDKAGKEVASDTVLKGSLFVKKAKFWWPYLMDPNPGYLYSLRVELFDTFDRLVDKYVLPVGIRKITWDSKNVKINDKPIYLRGFGKHEDSDFRGKGLDLPLFVKDFNLIKWVGANSFRTSYYPYAEEIMDMADRLGIMVIDESPAVNIATFSDEVLENHKKSLAELIQRDKNRPAVIIWSAANEPSSELEESENYFKEVVAHIKTLDKTRPVTVANNQLHSTEYSGQFLDVASCNMYYGWDSQNGNIDVITDLVFSRARRWNKLHDIPVLVTEYGAESLEGLHTWPVYVWSEEYQDELLSQYFRAFDQLRAEGYFIGEMIWNFADFKTEQINTHVGGSKKGIFTRNRQPKDSAHLLRRRYWALAESIDDAVAPDDIDSYVFENVAVKDEL